jgi:hypothetical protein
VATRSWLLSHAPLATVDLVPAYPPAKLRSTFYSFLFILACCLLPAVAWGWAGAVVGVGVAGWITRGPQLVTLLRANSASGVSSSSWLTAALVSSLWVVYYVGARLWPVMIVTAVAGTVSLIIAALARWRHAQVHGSTNIVDLAPTLGAFED